MCGAAFELTSPSWKEISKLQQSHILYEHSGIALAVDTPLMQICCLLLQMKAQVWLRQKIQT